LSKVEKNLELASSYWTLRSEDTGLHHPTDWKGRDIYERIVKGEK